MKRLTRQLLLLQQQRCPATLAFAQHLVSAMPQQRAYQAAVDQDVVEPPRQQPDTTIQSQQQAWAPRRSLPPPAYYGVQVLIRAHELKLVKLASTVVRDLALVNFAPKSREAAATSRRRNVPWVELAMPIGDAALPTRRTHFTVIRGPHVHKTSREQFARITHQRPIQYSTNNVSELHWFLDSLKLYKFIGVEMTVKVSSSSYLLPTTSEQQAAAEQPLLQQHKQRFAHLFGAAAPSSYSPAQQLLQQDSSSRSSSYAALQQSMQGLRESVHQGLLHQRVQLADKTNFKRWQDGRRKANAAAPSTASSISAQVIADLVSRQVHGSNLADSPDYQKQHAFLAAVDKALVSLKLDVLDRHKYFPYLMAFYKLGQQKTPPAEWMHAMLKYGKMRQQEVDSSQTATALEVYQQYGQVTQTLLLQMLQQWYQAADSQARKELGLPDAEMVDDMMGSGGLGRVRSAAFAVADETGAGASPRAGSRPGTTAAEKGYDETTGDAELEVGEGFVDDAGDDSSSLVDLERDRDSSRRSRGSALASRFNFDRSDRSKYDRYTAGGGGVDRYTPKKGE